MADLASSNSQIYNHIAETIQTIDPTTIKHHHLSQQLATDATNNNNIITNNTTIKTPSQQLTNTNKRRIDSLNEDNITNTQTAVHVHYFYGGDAANKVTVGNRQPLKKYRLNDYANDHSDEDTSCAKVQIIESASCSSNNNINQGDIKGEFSENNKKINKKSEQQQQHKKEHSCDRGEDTDLRQKLNLLAPVNRTDKTISDNIIALRFLIRRREAGAIIGKRGSNIRQLRDTFNSEFLIPDTGNGPERVLNITTNRKFLDKILKQLSELLYEKSPTTDSDDQVELRMLIHSSHAGTIIGKGGNSIKKLRDESKAAIKIFALCCPLSNERVVAIKAKPPVVVSTIKLILNIISESSIKGVVKPYDALNFDQNISDRYGGYKYDETDQPPNGSFIAPQQLPPLPFSPNSFNHPPSNHFMPMNNYRLHATPNMSSYQNCPPCRSVFAAQALSPCTNCHHQRAEHSAHLVQHRQLPHHQFNHQCGSRFCSDYHQMPNNVRNSTTHNGHKFNHIHM